MLWFLSALYFPPIKNENDGDTLCMFCVVQIPISTPWRHRYIRHLLCFFAFQNSTRLATWAFEVCQMTSTCCTRLTSSSRWSGADIKSADCSHVCLSTPHLPASLNKIMSRPSHVCVVRIPVLNLWNWSHGCVCLPLCFSAFQSSTWPRKWSLDDGSNNMTPYLEVYNILHEYFQRL